MRKLNKVVPAIIKGLVDSVTVLIYVSNEQESIDMHMLMGTSTEEEFTNATGIYHHEVVLYGDTSYPPPDYVMSHIIDGIDIKVSDGEVVKSYTCFANANDSKFNKDDNIIAHQKPEASYYCILDYLLRPEYIIILKVENKRLKDFKLEIK